MELDLTSTFDSSYLRFQKNDRLSELVSKVSLSLKNKSRKATGGKGEDRLVMESLVKTFLCSYKTIDDLIGEKNQFAGEETDERIPLARVYSLYSAAKGICNLLDCDYIGWVRSSNSLPAAALPLSESDVRGDSEYHVLTKLLPKIDSGIEGSTMDVLKYSAFSFFKRVHDISAYHISHNCNDSTKEKLRKIQIRKPGLDFRPIPEPRKPERLITVGTTFAGDEDLPTEIVQYDASPKADLRKVIGNTQVLETLYAAIIRAAKYDPKIGKNPFSINGYRFQDSFMIHGEPGVGKTFMMDSLFNKAIEMGRQYGIDFVPCDLSKGIKSKWMDRGSAIFERYIDIQRAGDKIYLNLIDEADGIFPVNEKGELHPETQKLLRDMKTAINRNFKGNALYFFLTNYPDRFEGALKQRFKPLSVPGPVAPHEFAQIYRQELGPYGQHLTEEDYQRIGMRTAEYKIALTDPRKKMFITGRTIQQVVTPFVEGDDRVILANADMVLKASTNQTLDYLPKLSIPITYSSLQNSLDRHVHAMKESSVSKMGGG